VRKQLHAEAEQGAAADLASLKMGVVNLEQQPLCVLRGIIAKLRRLSANRLQNDKSVIGAQC